MCGHCLNSSERARVSQHSRPGCRNPDCPTRGIPHTARPVPVQPNPTDGSRGSWTDTARTARWPGGPASCHRSMSRCNPGPGTTGRAWPAWPACSGPALGGLVPDAHPMSHSAQFHSSGRHLRATQQVRDDLPGERIVAHPNRRQTFCLQQRTQCVVAVPGLGQRPAQVHVVRGTARAHRDLTRVDPVSDLDGPACLTGLHGYRHVPQVDVDRAEGQPEGVALPGAVGHLTCLGQGRVRVLSATAENAAVRHCMP